MIDDTHVVVASGTGARMVPAPEMAAFAERFGFVFRAHEKGACRAAAMDRVDQAAGVTVSRSVGAAASRS